MGLRVSDLKEHDRVILGAPVASGEIIDLPAVFLGTCSPAEAAKLPTPEPRSPDMRGWILRQKEFALFLLADRARASFAVRDGRLYDTTDTEIEIVLKLRGRIG